MFLPIVFVLYWFVFQKREWQNMLIVIASYVFYGWWDWRFLFLIAFTSLCSFFSGILIERIERGIRPPLAPPTQEGKAALEGTHAQEGKKRQRQRLVCAVNLIVNFLILGVFKYYNFFADSLAQLVWSLFHYQLDWVTLNVILPVGISFYTFQALSYTIDVYRKDVPVTKNIIEFCAFISFFPQLVAGPIERAKNLLPQFQRDRHFDYVQAVDGCRQMLWGFFKKVVIADSCASDLNPLWDSYADYSGVSLWLLALLFTFQIYCDFSGYSDIAIGCSRLFGIRLSVRHQVVEQLQLSLSVEVDTRVLAAMAYLTDDVVPRLCLYSPRWQPLCSVEGDQEYVYRVWRQWSLAWGELDVRMLGLVSWYAGCSLSVVRWYGGTWEREYSCGRH